jgi:tetratricopeptide (TPR) repeat protein
MSSHSVRLRQIVMEFLQAPDEQACRNILDNHPELLDQEAEDILDNLSAARLLMSAESALRFDERYLMLQKCREESINALSGEDSALASSERADLLELFAKFGRENPDAVSELDELFASLLDADPTDPHSLSEISEVTCSECYYNYKAEMWVVIDAQERPDLAEQCRDRTIHNLQCPQCGRTFTPDRPLMYHDGEARQLILAVPSETTLEEDRETNRRLVQHLFPRLADANNREYLNQTRNVPGVEGLQMLLQGEDPNGLLRGLLHSLSEVSDSTDRTLEQRLSELAEAFNGPRPEESLLDTISQFVLARTWIGSKRVVQTHPALLSHEADKALEQMVALAHLFDQDSTQVLEDHRRLLQRCREVGINEAFAEQMGISPDSEANSLVSMLDSLTSDETASLQDFVEASDSPEEAMQMLSARGDIQRILMGMMMTADRADNPELLIIRGGLLEEHGQWDEASNCYVKALAAYEQSGNLHGEVEALVNLGDIFHKRGQYDMALTLYQRALQKAEAVGNMSRVTDIYASMAGVYLSQGDYDKSAELFNQAAAEIEKSGDKRKLAAFYNNRAILYAHRGDFVGAETFYYQIIDIYHELGDDEQIGSVFGNLGSLFAEQNQDRRAMEMFEKCLEIEQRFGHEANMASTYNNIAVIHERMENYEKALEIYEKSLEIARRLGAESDIAATYGNLGGLYAKLHDTNHAIAHFQRALEIADRIGEKDTLAIVCFDMGQVYHSSGDREQAIQYFKRAKVLFAQLGNKEREVIVSLLLLTLGQIE